MSMARIPRMAPSLRFLTAPGLALLLTCGGGGGNPPNGGSGRIIWMLNTQGDMKVQVQMTGEFSYYLDHVILDAGIGVGTQVTAGQRLGQTLHTDSPFKYFAEPLKSQLYAKVRRNAPDKDGRIDYDVRSRLIGNWFHESVAIADSMGPAGGPSSWPSAPTPMNPPRCAFPSAVRWRLLANGNPLPAILTQPRCPWPAAGWPST